MLIKTFKILFLITIFLYHTSVFSKPNENQSFNQRYLSNYFSALVSHENGNNELALKYFDLTKSILRTNPEYFNQYLNSLVLENKVKEAIKKLKFFNSKNKENNFQAILLLTIDAFKNNNFNKVKIYLSDMEKVLIPKLD